MKNYPKAYCVKCRKVTDTQNKHSIFLQNLSRAVKGTCPECGSEVYKFLTKAELAKLEAMAAGLSPEKMLSLGATVRQDAAVSSRSRPASPKVVSLIEKLHEKNSKKIHRPSKPIKIPVNSYKSDWPSLFATKKIKKNAWPLEFYVLFGATIFTVTILALKIARVL